MCNTSLPERPISCVIDGDTFVVKVGSADELETLYLTHGEAVKLRRMLDSEIVESLCEERMGRPPKEIVVADMHLNVIEAMTMRDALDLRLAVYKARADYEQQRRKQRKNNWRKVGF